MNAWFDTMDLLAADTAGGSSRRAANGTRLLVGGAPLATVNGVFTPESPYPDLGEVAELAAVAAAELAVPWCLHMRGEPSPELLEIGARHGRTTRSATTFMTCAAGDLRLGPPDGQRVPVRAVTSAQGVEYQAAVAAGFEVPAELFGSFMRGPELDAPGATAYLAGTPGDPVATGFGVLAGEWLGVFNIATPPAHRRHGYARAVTEHILRSVPYTGVFLTSTEMALPLYESMGFRVAETWTYLT
ncbi:hypothetical protein Ahu01nite_096030 [Winogradskya humida]|uniref:N-acetyltransferase domain-containing protein n=1 Tax=Winogradskya humida TaxID=113566 RepID=A0ABQ4A6K8_9ACTN|nr:hypothetical protein Ahu01nite_096030 [Actinoplanes humidus]